MGPGANGNSINLVSTGIDEVSGFGSGPDSSDLSSSSLVHTTSSDGDSVLQFFPDENCTIFTSGSDSMSACNETPAATDDDDDDEASAVAQVQLQDPPFFKLVGDNIDKTVRPREETSDYHNKSLHYFHTYAVRDRIYVSGLDDSPHLPDIEGIDTLTVLPTDDDRNVLKHNMSIIAGKQQVIMILCKVLKLPSGRIVRKHSNFLKKSIERVTPHIPHRYSKEMAKKSEVVC